MPPQPIRPAATRSTKRRGRGGRGDDDGTNRWLTTYADAVTLLMAFFVLLYAMSEIDVVKFTAFLQGLRVPFGNQAGDGMMPLSDGLMPDIAIVPPGEPDEPPEVPTRFIERADGDEDGEAEGGMDREELREWLAELEAHRESLGIDHDELLDLLEQLDESFPEDPDRGLDALQAHLVAEVERRARIEAQLDEVQQALTTALGIEGVEMHVDQRRTERGLVVSIASDEVLFALGSTVIDARGQTIVATIAEILAGFPNSVQIEGHTDTVPLNRAGYTNWNLSTDRAVAVLSSMVEEYGFAPDRIGAVGYGEYRPVADNDTAEGRALNRRVDVVILLEEPEA